MSPPVKDPNMNKLTIAVTLAVIIGIVFGILKSTSFILSNRYLQAKMYYLILDSVSSAINHYLLITVGVIISIYVMLMAIRALLKFFGLSRQSNNIIVYAIVPSLLVFVLGGYLINKRYLPEFSALKSIIGNFIWALTCILLGWLAGRITLRVYQIKHNFSLGIFGIKTLVGLVSLVALFNVAPHFYLWLLSKPERPNVILISIDTLRADHLSCYGYSRNTSPNIDRFTKDGILFANTIAQSSWTLPSHMALFTSLYPIKHGVFSRDSKLIDEHLTLAEILQNAGYETVAFTDGAFLSHKFGYQGFNLFDDTGDILSGGVEKIYTKVIDWLRKNPSKPFFLFLHTYQVHAPYNPPPAYDIYSDASYRGIVNVLESDFESIRPRMILKDYIYLIDKYDGEIFYTDRFLGKLFDELKGLELYDKSIIVFTSDHGENFLEHRAYKIGHYELYDEIVKVPLIIKAPTLPKNKITETQVESIDIMPTILELLEISIPDGIDGESLVELVKKGSYDDGIFAFSEADPYYKMIRSKDWKLLRRYPNKLELFDLTADPKEQHNLFAEKPKVAKSLHEKLHTWIGVQEKRSEFFSSDRIQLDDEMTEKLKALGYIN